MSTPIKTTTVVEVSPNKGFDLNRVRVHTRYAHDAPRIGVALTRRAELILRGTPAELIMFANRIVQVVVQDEQEQRQEEQTDA